MGKTKKSAKSSNSVRFLRRSRALQSFKRDFRFANDPKVELARVKHNADLRDLFDLMPLIFKDAPTYDLIHGSAFPRGLNLLFSVPPIHRPADLVREIIWGIGRCLKFSEALRGFVLQRRLFEIEILQDNQQSAAHTLAKIKESFGYSFWLAQNELAIARHWGGLAEMKQCYDGLGLNENSANIISTLLWFVRHRIEATMELSQLKGELVNAMSKIDSESARAFFRAKLFDFMEISPLDMAPLLYRDAQSSLIDHYESLVAVLQSLSSLKDVPTALLDNLSIPIQSLLKATKDIRLNAVSRAFGKIDFPEDPSFDNREVAIEAFLGGRFDESVLASNAVLAKAPDDMAIFVLKHKALIATDAAIPEYSGVLSRLSKDITCLLQFSKETYEAAHDILLLSSQFFGLNWIAYLRAVAHYELRAESDEYPPIWLRDMHVRDLGVSPFSAVACANSVVDQFLKDEQFERKFKLSKIAYAAITEGLNLTEAGIDSTRYDMLRARYELTFGSSLAAQSIYSRLIPIVRGRGFTY